MPGAWTALHEAAYENRPKALSEVLEFARRKGAVLDIDQAGGPEGWTPLMVAAFHGFSGVVGVLLNKGASVSIVGDGGVSALHLSAREGHVMVAKLLVRAGANMEAGDSQGDTPLNDAAERGQYEVMRALIEAGANVNCRGLDGSTPLFIAAQLGHVEAVRVLLQGGANPQLVNREVYGKPYGCLDVAAQNGHPKVIRELVQHRGIEGCGGASRGNIALEAASQHERLEIMGLLLGAGVVDTGQALGTAAGTGSEASVKYLLQQKKEAAGRRRAYANFRDPDGLTAMSNCIGFSYFVCPSPRILRLLVDAGGDTRSKARLVDRKGAVAFHGTLVALAARNLREKKVGEKDATEEQLNRLEGIRRLLLRVDAVHALSWLWPSSIGAPLFVHSPEAKGGATAVTATAITGMLPALRRRARRPKVLVAALFRWVPMCSAKVASLAICRARSFWVVKGYVLMSPCTRCQHQARRIYWGSMLSCSLMQHYWPRSYVPGARTNATKALAKFPRSVSPRPTT